MASGDSAATTGRTMRRALSGVRGRSVIASVVVVGVSLAVGAVLLLVLLQRSLISDVQQAATTRALEVAALVRTGPLPGLSARLASTTKESQIIQVVDAQGRVAASSTSRASITPLTTAKAPDGQVEPVRAGRVPLLDDDEPYQLVVGGVTAHGQTYQVVVAASIRPQQQSVSTVLSLLLFSFPVLLLLVGLSTWWLVGRALAPVERIRAQVSHIGGTRVDKRIPVPRTEDEIARLAETMNEMLARLDEAGQAQRRFVADASHELRSPLATLVTSLEVAAADPSGRTRGDLAPVMEAEVRRMSRLVEDLLLLAKADEHAVRLDLVDVDLDDLAGEEVSRLRTTRGLRIEPHVRPVRVQGDPDRLRQVITNLADNAARHARSTVRLRVGPDGDDALVVVEDDGPGIAPKDRQHVFERFVRLDDSRGRSSGGSGLGLAIVQEIVRAHHGSVVIADAEGGGCRMEVRIPCVQQTAGAQPPSAARR